MNFTEWISSTAGTTFLLGVLGFLSRHWIIDRLSKSIELENDKKLEQHKADLKREYDVQVEKLKAELAQQQFRFSHVFEKTAETMIEIYAKLLKLQSAVKVFDRSSRGATLEQINNYSMTVDEERKSFYEYFMPRKIFLCAT